ncbi:MAG: NAD(P)-binding protein [Candidatus Omnitrophota bacterium]|jgi:protoporphyrinogen oxidase
MEKRVVIIGGGPTGLGAAYRLKELKHKNWVLLEKEQYVGGLSASVKDDLNFIWDKGGHVLFSHYKYFDDIVEKLLYRGYVEHERKAYIYCMKKWIPYPFQNNIRHLPKDAMFESIMGLIISQQKEKNSHNFKEWIVNTFGEGIANYFMMPQNLKTWAHPLEDMDNNWIKERISVIDPVRILKNILYNKDDNGWGPNNKFKFPLHGGTGGLFSKFEPIFKENLCLGKKVVKIDMANKKLALDDDEVMDYDILINTSPLDLFVKMMRPCAAKRGLEPHAKCLKHSSSYVVGLGLKGRCRSSKCWMYFPESNFPFYRVTYFSNYSKYNVPDSKANWSLMCETSYSKYKKIDKTKIVNETIKGLLDSNIISDSDRKNIISTHTIDIGYSYPVPTIGRDKALKRINLFLEDNSVYSRGRFGAWRYEIGNMDHSFMQGKEVIDKVLLDKNEITYNSK